MKLLLKILLPAVVLGASGLLAAYLIQNRSELKPQPRVESLPLVEVRGVKAGAHRLLVRSQGEVTPRTEIELVGEVPGRVVAVSTNFALGGFFASGEVLVRLDPRDFEVAVAQARAGLAQARVRLEREQAEARVAREEWEALGRGDANPLLLRQPQLAEAEATVEAAAARLGKAELDLDRCEVRAPFAGRVRIKHADVGQYVSSGMSLARVYAVDFSEVRLPVPLEDFAHVDLPLNSTNEAAVPVVLRAAVGGRPAEWRGQIVRSEGAVDRRTRMLGVVARVRDPYDLQGSGRSVLPVGLFVEAEIEGRELSGVHAVPRAAVRGRDVVLVVDPEDHLRFRPVEIARRLEEEVLVTRGLEPGDRVVVSALDAPVDGMAVRTREVVPVD